MELDYGEMGGGLSALSMYRDPTDNDAIRCLEVKVSQLSTSLQLAQSRARRHETQLNMYQTHVERGMKLALEKYTHARHIYQHRSAHHLQQQASSLEDDLNRSAESSIVVISNEDSNVRDSLPPAVEAAEEKYKAAKIEFNAVAQFAAPLIMLRAASEKSGIQSDGHSAILSRARSVPSLSQARSPHAAGRMLDESTAETIAVDEDDLPIDAFGGMSGQRQFILSYLERLRDSFPAPSDYDARSVFSAPPVIVNDAEQMDVSPSIPLEAGFTQVYEARQKLQNQPAESPRGNRTRMLAVPDASGQSRTFSVASASDLGDGAWQHVLTYEDMLEGCCLLEMNLQKLRKRFDDLQASYNAKCAAFDEFKSQHSDLVVMQDERKASLEQLSDSRQRASSLDTQVSDLTALVSGLRAALAAAETKVVRLKMIIYQSDTSLISKYWHFVAHLLVSSSFLLMSYMRQLWNGVRHGATARLNAVDVSRFAALPPIITVLQPQDAFASFTYFRYLHTIHLVRAARACPPPPL